MITEKELEKLQKLAKLSFSHVELSDFSKKLNSVVMMINTLTEVNCQDVEPMRSVCDMYQRTRIDEVKVGNISEQLFVNLSQQNSDLAKEVKCFIVPKMVE
jgi:aspartyl-tRNA(Asn)/glutamyl-tRNA(Gln) amidotransferase subunit C